MKEFSKHISESAFLVNESRARNVELSRDHFAHLWVQTATRKLWEDFSREVYPYDDIELSVRNRFFLERLNEFIQANPAPVFVNIGAGFTSYPFLVDKPCTCIDVDFAHVIEYKRRKIAGWWKEGALPARDLQFIATDLLNEKEADRLLDNLRAQLYDIPSFILLEGLTYYLDMPLLKYLFDTFSRLQSVNSVLAFDFWTPDSINHPVFNRLQKFFSKRFGHEEKSYNLFYADFVKSIPHYHIVEITSVQEQEIVFARTTHLAEYENILPESYTILRKASD